MTQELTKLVQRLNITSLRTPRADRDAMAEAAAAIKALAAAQEWQDIETAPMDGTPFLAMWSMVDAGDQMIVTWGDSDWNIWRTHCECCRSTAYGLPTKWRPLPAPPVVTP